MEDEERSHDAGHVRWEQFLDLLTVAGVMLFIFGRLLVSGSASALEASGGTRCALRSVRAGRKKNKKIKTTHTCKMSLERRCSHTQLHFTISLVGPGADHSLRLILTPELLPLSIIPT